MEKSFARAYNIVDDNDGMYADNIDFMVGIVVSEIKKNKDKFFKKSSSGKYLITRDTVKKIFEELKNYNNELLYDVTLCIVIDMCLNGISIDNDVSKILKDEKFIDNDLTILMTPKKKYM